MKEEMETAERLSKYSGITLGVVLVTAFVLVQPTMNQTYAVGVEGLPAYDNCDQKEFGSDSDFHEDPISMNTVRNKDIVKTIHAEKEVFFCFLEQGDLEVTVDLTTYLEVYENITSQEVIETNAVATTCMKDRSFDSTATVIDCESYQVSTSPVFVGSTCEEETDITHPQEMNTVTKGKIAKTIEAQKEVFECELPDATFCEENEESCVEKKVDIVLFTEIYEDLNTQETTSVQFLSARCIVIISDHENDILQDAFVESCIFDEIEN